MPFKSDTFNVLIATPSDVVEERKKIAEAIHSWTVQNSNRTQQVLVPIMWETNSVPLLSNTDGQAEINRQLVDKCDLLVGAFWSRIGSETPRAIGGTVEEIQHFIASGKPALLYFCNRDVPQANIDFEQLTKLKNFKKEIMEKNLVGSYKTPDDLSTQLNHHLTQVMGDINVKTTVELVYSDSKIDANIVYYTDKSFLVTGDLYKAKAILEGLAFQELKIGKLEGLCFSNKRLKVVANKLGIPPHISQK